MYQTAALIILLSCIGSSGGSQEEDPPAIALERELERITKGKALWPGFDPLAVPLAVFDGTNTYLFRHPEPPEKFREKQGAHVFEGRHQAVTANCSAMIGNVRTATLLLEPRSSERTLGDMAAVAVHEAFHVFQFTTDRIWGADETYLFTYPMDNAQALSLRRAETEALRRAFASQNVKKIARWAKLALGFRKDRFALLDAPYIAYERGIEVGEGTATYVEYKAAGRKSPELPPAGFGLEDVRSRAYITGVAWALLLDRFRPGWREGFADDSGRFPDIELASVLRGVEGSPECRLAEALVAEHSRRAQAEVAGFLASISLQRKLFESASGWRLIIETDKKSPLWPKGYDPLNIRRVKDGLLHTRFLKLGNEKGCLEVMGGAVLTEGVGPHPILNGVHRLILAGLEKEPKIEVRDGRVVVDLPFFSADFHGAAVEKSGKTLFMRFE